MSNNMYSQGKVCRALHPILGYFLMCTMVVLDSFMLVIRSIKFYDSY